MKRIGLLCRLPGVSRLIQQKVPTYQVQDIEFDINLLNNKTVFNGLLDDINGCDILLASPDYLAPFLYHVKNTKWIQSTWAGNDVVLNLLEADKPLPSFHFTKFSVFGRHLSEYVISNIINFERRAFHLYDNQKKCLWENSQLLLHCTATLNEEKPPYRVLSSLSIAILGIGEIGKEMAKFCKTFDMTVYGMVSRIPDNKLPYIDEYFLQDELNTYLSKADYVCNVLPKTSKTDGLFDNERLKHCEERKSVFINVGRGNVVRNESIIEALDKKWIGGAILDVFEKEPLNEDSKLWKYPNVVITPHFAGQSLTYEVIDVFLDNLKLFEEDKPLNYLIDWKKGY